MTTTTLPNPPHAVPDDALTSADDRVLSGVDAGISAGDRVPRGRIAAPIITHVAVDYLSFVTIALLPLLAVRLSLTPTDKSVLIGVGAIASGSIQPVVAWIGDKLNTRALATAGVVVAGVCIGLIGRAQSFEQLLVLYGLGAMGVGAFHPAASAAVGHMAGAHRSGMLAVFFLAGMVGGILGNVFSPHMVALLGTLSGLEGNAATDAGLRALIWLIVPALGFAVYLAVAIHSHEHRHADAHDSHRSLPKQERGRRWLAFWILYAANVIRFSTNMALVYLYVEWIEALVARRAGVETLTVELGARASAINGPMQAAMQVGMGGAGLLLGFKLSQRLEKRAFVLIPLLGAIPIALFPYADRLPDQFVVPAAAALAVLSGVGFGSLIPVSLSLGQRLLPHRTAFTSGMLLGGAWVFASLGAQFARLLHVGTGESWLSAGPFSLIGGTDGRGLDAAFFGIACLLLVAAALGMMLPGRTLRGLRAH